MRRNNLLLISLVVILTGWGCLVNGQALTGTKTIGTGGDYSGFSQAITALNTNGVGTGGVIFNVNPGSEFNERPPAITATGNESDQIVFRKSGAGTNPVIKPSGTSSGNEAGIIISGGDYITFDGIDINSSAVPSIEYGYLIRNAGTTNGAKHNTIRNFTVTLNRNHSTSAYGAGVMQSTDPTFGGGTAPTAQSGANDFNRYQNFSIQNCSSGIVMLGGSFQDLSCEISTTGNSIRNTLTDLGNTNGTFNFGIYVFKGAAVTISNCDISALNGWGDNVIGINLNEYGSSCTVNNNSIRDLNNSGTSTSFRTIGVRTNHVYAGNGSVSFYNNTISDLKCASSGPTTTSKVLGAYLCAYESNEIVNFYHNTISIGFGKSWDFRSAGVTNNGRTPDVYMYGNIVANYAANSGTSARQYCITAQHRYLADGFTDYNLYYCKNSYIGSAEGWDALDLTAWQSLVQYGKEANSVSGNPYLVEPNADLHGTGSKAIGQPGYTVPAYITDDMDHEARGIPTALGADTYSPIEEDSSVLAPVSQVPGGDLDPVANTVLDALEVFRFNLSDSGGDGFPTKILSVQIKRSYVNNYAELTTVLQGAVLKVNGVSISTATAVITNEDITFTIPEGDLNLADGVTAECGLFVYFKTSGIVDGKSLKFMISSDDHGFTNAFWGSRLVDTLAADIISNDFRINVIATQLRLIHPDRELLHRLWSFSAEAVNTNGTIDTDYSGIAATVSLHTGTGVLGGTLQSFFNGGSCSWNVSYGVYEWIKLQVNSGSLSGISGYIQINPYIEVSSGPVPGSNMNWNTPFIYDYYYGRSVALYTNPEVNGFYSIEALSWNVASTLNTYNPLPVKIYLKAYTGTFYGLNSFTSWESLISGATLVYNGTTNAMNSTGWRKINLDTVFNNQSNPQSLLVFVESNQALYYQSSTPTFAGNYLNSPEYHYSGASAYSSLPSPFNVTKQQFRPHIRFWVTAGGYYEDTVTEQSSTAPVSANSGNQQIIRVNVQTGGSLSPQTISSLTFNSSGTTDPTDIMAARVFYTGSSSTFSSSTQFGATITNPGSMGTFTVTGNLNVPSGNHYFWLVYDLGANLAVGDHFDAQCTAVSVNNISRIPSVTDPAGYRSVAGKKLTDVYVTQLGQGTTSSGAQNLGILQIDLYVSTGTDAQSYASLPLNSISITGKNTNNTDVSAVKLANQSNPSSFLATASMASGTASFTNLNYELEMGTNSIYVYYDLSSGAGAGNIVDAKIMANAIDVAGGTHPASEQDPSGQYNIENFNYGGGYAQQGGYYFANTLALPAPSHPTFSWMDISASGYNSFGEMSGDDGIAPNDNTGYSIGFSFPYFGNSFTKFWIGADGTIFLSKPSLPLNQGAPPANAISPFNSDFHPAVPNYPKTILYQNVDGKLVVTYLKVQPKTGASLQSYATFQVILFPTGKIKIQFLEFGSSFPTNNGAVWIVNSNATAFHAYAYGGQAGPITGTSPIAVAYGQNAFMLSDTGALNDLPVPASGTPTISFTNTGATVAFVTSTAPTNLTAIRVETNPGGALPEGILSLADRHWTINSTSTTGLGSYNLSLNLAGIANLQSATEFFLMKREHVSSAWTNIGTPLIYNSALKQATWLINSGFSDFGIGFAAGNTLPLELSSFSAVSTTLNSVTLQWTTESETNLSGYYIYRSTDQSISNALNLNRFVPAANSSTSHQYLFTDEELESAGTYFYWLQSVDMDGSTRFYGSVAVIIQGGGTDPIPVIPLVNSFDAVYPNPFNPDATIRFSLKEVSGGSLSIFNQRGQLIRQFTITDAPAGQNSIYWNGKDKQGREMGSGVYLFILRIGDQTFSRKATIIK